MNDLLIGNRGIDSEIGNVESGLLSKSLFLTAEGLRVTLQSTLDIVQYYYGTMQVSVYINWANKPGST